VREARSRIATKNFDLLLSDLHMRHAGDGFTVVSAMRHTHPEAVTLVLSGYPPSCVVAAGLVKAEGKLYTTSSRSVLFDSRKQ
jgi:CheY-like chemotaxis protein